MSNEPSTDPSGPSRVLHLPRPVPVAEVQGALALDLAPRHDPPPAPTEVGLGLAGGAVAVTLPARRALELWSRRYAQAAVEIVGGDRPASQLARWTAGQVHEDLCRRAQLVARAGGHRPGAGRVQPVRPRVLSVRTCFLTPSVVEAGAHVRYGERSRALALRFERRHDRWVCTALEFA